VKASPHGGWARWLAFAALIAFAWQSIVTQSHVHFDRGAVSPAVHHDQSPPDLHRVLPRDAPVTCPICRAFAQAGHYLSPGTVILGAALASATWLTGPHGATWIGQGRSHAWYSRGPPPPRFI
jgi:hypothetical protein